MRKFFSRNVLLRQFVVIFGFFSLYRLNFVIHIEFHLLKTFLSFIILSLSLFSSLLGQRQNIEKGIFDARGLDLGGETAFQLNGAWKFYFGDFLSQSQMDAIENPLFLNVPGVWEDVPVDDKKLPGQGAATYSLKIILDDNSSPNLALKLLSIASSHRLYVNGSLLSTAGEIGKSRKESVPFYKPEIVDIPFQADTLDILVHVSNYHYKKGGLWRSIYFGSQKGIYSIQQSNLAFDLFLIGAILMIGLYHIGLYIVRRKDSSPFYFSLLCFFVVLRMSTVQEISILKVFPTLSWEWLINLEYLSFFLSLGLGGKFIHWIFPQEFRKRISNINMSVWVGLSLLVLALPALYSSEIVPFSQFLTIAVCAYYIWVLIQAIIRKRQGARLALAGFGFVVIAIINDILYFNYFLNFGSLIQLGIFFMFFCQSLIIAQRFSSAFTQSESLSLQLKQVNTHLEEKVEERTAEIEQQKSLILGQRNAIEEQRLKLQRRNDDLMASITYAKHIQDSILPRKSDIKKAFPESFIFFKPKDEVSGDFYWFKDFGDEKVIAAVDCTGHGIPGAFMSLITNELLNEIISLKGIRETDYILSELRTSIQQVLNQEETDNRDGLDLSLCRIRKNSSGKRVVEFSGVGNPLIYFQDEELLEIKGDRLAIGGYGLNDKHFSRTCIEVESPTTFYLFSDGYLDQFGGPKNKKFTIRRFRELLTEIQHQSLKEQAESLANNLVKWSGENRQIDDIIVVAFTVHP